MATARPLNLDLPRSRLGEGVCWDERGRLLWTDIISQRVHIYDVAKADLAQVDTRLPVSFVFPSLSDHELIVGLANGVYRLSIRNGDEQPIATLALPEHHRLNDGKCDSTGHLWAGTINTSEDPSETAALYLLGPNGLTEIESGYTNANGKAWSPDGAVLYHADTARSTIWQYGYDIETAAISNKRVFVTLNGASPDGLAADITGNVYAAIYGGSCVRVFSPRGEELERIELPVPNVTSCAFGGDELRTLFITTAYDGMDEAGLEAAPLSGHVFAVERDIAGIPCRAPVLPLLQALREATL
jgi:sugar lactone lactonase YvrE